MVKNENDLTNKTRNSNTKNYETNTTNHHHLRQQQQQQQQQQKAAEQ